MKYQHKLVIMTALNKQSKIDIISTMILIGFITTLLKGLLLSSKGMLVHIFPFLFSSPNMFSDFYLTHQATLYATPYTLHVSHFNYFASTYHLAKLIGFLPEKVGLYLIGTTFILFFMGLCRKYLNQGGAIATLKNSLIFSFLSYPFAFALSRGNYECILFMLITLFVIYYPDIRKAKITACLLALSIAMKLFPAVFLILYLGDKRYKEVVYISLLALAISVVSYALLQQGLVKNIQDHLINLSLYNKDYAIGNGGLAFGHSLFGMLKFFMAHLWPSSYTQNTIYLFKLYPFIAFFLFFSITFYLLKIETVFWKKIALLVLCMDLLPHVSADYKLLYLYLPAFLFIDTKETSCFDSCYALIFSLLLMFKSYNYYQFSPETQIVPFAVNNSVFLNPIIMMVAIGLIVYQGLFRRNT